MYGRASGFALLLIIAGVALVLAVIRGILDNAGLPTRSQNSDWVANLLGIAVGIVLTAWGLSLMMLLNP